MAKRSFQNIQAVFDGRGVALIAIADDGTAWTAQAHSRNGYIPGTELEWRKIDDLPAADSKRPVGIVV